MPAHKCTSVLHYKDLKEITDWISHDNLSALMACTSHPASKDDGDRLFSTRSASAETVPYPGLPHSSFWLYDAVCLIKIKRSAASMPYYRL